MDEPTAAERERVIILLEGEKSAALREGAKLLFANDSEAETFTHYAAHLQRVLDLIKGRL